MAALDDDLPENGDGRRAWPARLFVFSHALTSALLSSGERSVYDGDLSVFARSLH